MSSENATKSEPTSDPVPARPADQQLVDNLVDPAQAEVIQLTDERGLLQQLWNQRWKVRSPTTSAMTSTTQPTRRLFVQ
jgi:hypothetical protein